MIFIKTKLRDLILISLTGALIIILGYLLIPLVYVLPISIFKIFFIGPLFAIGITFILKKVNGSYRILLFSLLIGIILGLLFFIGMFFAIIIPGIMIEFIIFMNKKLKADINIPIINGIYSSILIISGFFLSAIFIGGEVKKILLNPIILIVSAIIIFIFSFYTSKITLSILDRLKIKEEKS